MPSGSILGARRRRMSGGIWERVIVVGAWHGRIIGRMLRGIVVVTVGRVVGGPVRHGASRESRWVGGVLMRNTRWCSSLKTDGRTYIWFLVHVATIGTRHGVRGSGHRRVDGALLVCTWCDSIWRRCPAPPQKEEHKQSNEKQSDNASNDAARDCSCVRFVTRSRSVARPRALGRVGAC